jgi:RNA polymerase sigma-70 factor (ECF subfamily)
MAVASADIGSLTALLADDAVMVSDGGGFVSAARRPVEGADRIARFLVGVGPRVPADAAVDVEELNGAPCLLVRVDGVVRQVLSLEVADGRIQSLQIVSNPEKLSHL